MTVYLIVGFIGLAVLGAAVVLGDFLDGLLPDIELGDGLFSVPVLAGFVAAFGFGAALADVTGAGGAATLGIGAGAGVGVGWTTMRLTRSLVNMPTDDTVRSADLVGRSGRVITSIRPAQLGEVSVSLAGQSLKLAARAEHALDRGTDVVVVEVLSPTSVLVTPSEAFWGREEPTT